MLIIEIILTIFAWRKGWKWLALLPTGLAIIIGFLIGFIVGLSGGDFESIKGISIGLDVLAIIALIIMLIKPPESKNTKDELNTHNTI